MGRLAITLLLILVCYFGHMLVPASLLAFEDREDKPNFIVIFTDDQGYNDLGCFGSKTIKTPNMRPSAAI